MPGTRLWEPLGTCSGEPCLGTCGTWLGNLFLGILLGNLFPGNLSSGAVLGNLWEPVPGNLAGEHCLGTIGNLWVFLGTLLGNHFLGTLLGNFGNLAWGTFGNPFLGTCSWEPWAVRIWLLHAASTCSETFTMAEDPKLALLGKNFAWTPVPGHLACKSVPGSFAWEPLLGNLAWEPVLGSLFLETCSWKPALGNLFRRTLLGNLSWEPVLGNIAWGPCLRNCSWEPCLETCSWKLFLGTFENLWESVLWEPLGIVGNLFLGTLLGNLLLRTLLGNLFLGIFGNMLLGTFLGDLCEPCSGTLLGNLGTLAIRILAPPTCYGTFTWLKTPSLRFWGKTKMACAQPAFIFRSPRVRL